MQSTLVQKGALKMLMKLTPDQITNRQVLQLGSNEHKLQ